jgi:catechol 2,3-dioxygenase-like lactoylglutathione lyase family enzyme
VVAFAPIAVRQANAGTTGGTSVRALIAALWLGSSLASGAAFAQAMPPNEVGVTMGHLHLNSRDVEANKRLFVALGGTAIKPGDFEIVRFPGLAVFLHLRPGAAASSGGTEGTVINHVGFLVPNVQEAVAKWKAAGVAVAPGSNERIDQAWITTADGLRVEILEDKNQTIPIRHHHVHFYVPQSAISDMQAWYAKHFGAKPGMRGQFQAADIPGANLTLACSYALGVIERDFRPDTPQKIDFWLRLLDIISASSCETIEPYIVDKKLEIRRPLEDYHLSVLERDKPIINSLISIFELLSKKGDQILS